MVVDTEWMNHPRLVIYPAEIGVAGVTLLGRYHKTRATPGIPEHSHHNAIEICFLVRGYQTYQVGTHWFRMRGGDVFIAFPNEPHSTGGLPEEKGVLYWIVLEVPPARKGFLGLPASQSRALLQALLNPVSRHFRGSWEMKTHLDAIMELHAQGNSDFNVFAITNHIRAFLQQVITLSQNPPMRLPARTLESALLYIEQHLDEPCPVSLLAEQTGLSEARFKARFKEEIGIPPAEYVLRIKLDEAVRQMKQGKENITTIAHSLGFSSSQYFATVFKRFMGMTPREMLARHQPLRSASSKKVLSLGPQ